MPETMEAEFLKVYSLRVGGDGRVLDQAHQNRHSPHLDLSAGEALHRAAVAVCRQHGWDERGPNYATALHQAQRDNRGLAALYSREGAIEGTGEGA